MLYLVIGYIVVVIGFIAFAVHYLNNNKDKTPYINLRTKGSARSIMGQFESNRTLNEKRKIVEAKGSKF